MHVGHSVAVIGGGNTAIDAAVAAKYLGATHVSILYRRAEANMSAFAFEYEHARRSGINFIWNARPINITEHTVECDNGNVIPAQTVIVAIGQSRLLETLEKIRTIELRNGQVVVNPKPAKPPTPNISLVATASTAAAKWSTPPPKANAPPDHPMAILTDPAVQSSTNAETNPDQRGRVIPQPTTTCRNGAGALAT